jgi:hypothetical protein
MPTAQRDFKSVMFLLSPDKNSPVRRDMHGNLIIKGVKKHKVTFRDDIDSETKTLSRFQLIQSPPLPTCKSKKLPGFSRINNILKFRVSQREP